MLGQTRWPVPFTKLAHETSQPGQEIGFFSGFGRPRLILLRIWGALAAKDCRKIGLEMQLGHPIKLEAIR